MPQLVFRFDDGGEEVFSLVEERVGVGREADNRIVIDNDYISAHHARFQREEDGGYRLVDLQSQNGTFVNGEAIGEARLRHGDRIRFGVYEVAYLDRPSSVRPAPTATANRMGAGRDEEAQLEDRIRAKQQELQSLEFQLAQMEDIARSLEGKLAPVVNPVALAVTTGGLGRTLIDEVERLEARHEVIRRQLEDRRERLRELEQTLLPDAEARLAEALQRRDEAGDEWRRLRQQIEEGEVRKREFEAREQGYAVLQASVEAMEKEHQAKKELLQLTERDWTQAETRLREARRAADQARADMEEALRRRGLAEEDCRESAGKLARHGTEIQEIKHQMGALRSEIAAEQEKRAQIIQEREEILRMVRQAQERLRLAEDRVNGVISGWDEFEAERLGDIARRKVDLDEQFAASEARLRKSREELQAVWEQIEREREDARRSIEDLRVRQYEPAKALHEELVLRSEALASELASQERRLDQVRRTIRDGEETEKLVSHSLERRGQALETLERRIGDEVAQIRAEFVSLQRPLTWEGPAPVPDFGPIFRMREGPQGATGRRTAPAVSDRASLIVYLPDHGERTWDFRHQIELKVEDEPLPLGFAGLAAATRGAVFTSLAMTVESELPVLFPPSGGLAASVAALKKLRAAMPKRVILGAWTRDVFEALTEEMHAGTNFQDLIGVLSLSNGSLTTDPYMNTFFESMNQGKRFLYLAPVLPWNPRTPVPLEGRKGLAVDLREFDPGSSRHKQMVGELRLWVEETRTGLTINEPSRGVARRFREQLELGPDWVSVRNASSYREWLEIMQTHVAAVSFVPLTFSSELLRDALLAHTPVLAPVSEPVSAFYPELAAYAANRVLPEPAALRLLRDPAGFDRLTRQADKRLLAEHSYPAAAKKLDEFLASLPR